MRAVTASQVQRSAAPGVRIFRTGRHRPRPLGQRTRSPFCDPSEGRVRMRHRKRFSTPASKTAWARRPGAVVHLARLRAEMPLRCLMRRQTRRPVPPAAVTLSGEGRPRRRRLQGPGLPVRCRPQRRKGGHHGVPSSSSRRFEHARHGESGRRGAAGPGEDRAIAQDRGRITSPTPVSRVTVRRRDPPAPGGERLRNGFTRCRSAVILPQAEPRTARLRRPSDGPRAVVVRGGDAHCRQGGLFPRTERFLAASSACLTAGHGVDPDSGAGRDAP